MLKLISGGSEHANESMFGSKSLPSLCGKMFLLKYFCLSMPEGEKETQQRLETLEYKCF